MLGSERDTIAAIATPPGVGGVGVVRVSGPQALAIACALTGRTQLPDRRLVRAVVRDAAGAQVDDVLVVAMHGPRSFTGEDVVEIHGHGGPINMGRLLRAVVERGARLAEGGEFTRRALANQRIDLVRAEALLDVISASSERAWRLAQRQLSGELGRAVHHCRELGTALLAEVEAHIDFPEEGLGVVAREDLEGALNEIQFRVKRLTKSYELGRLVREGLSVALVGPTNAGKSSLFNMLVGDERAVVDSEPGTTRDYVEEQLVFDGIPVCLIDTAGYRTEGTRAERRGIDLGRQRTKTADVVVVLHPPEGSADALDLALPGARIDVASKCDLGVNAPTEYLRVSTITGEGVTELREAITRMACGAEELTETGEVITSERQRDLLQAALDHFQAALLGLKNQPLELVALDVRGGVQQLAAVLGENVGEEVLDALFSRFCIGK